MFFVFFLFMDVLYSTRIYIVKKYVLKINSFWNHHTCIFIWFCIWRTRNKIYFLRHHRHCCTHSCFLLYRLKCGWEKLPFVLINKTPRKWNAWSLVFCQLDSFSLICQLKLSVLCITVTCNQILIHQTA